MHSIPTSILLRKANYIFSPFKRFYTFFGLILLIQFMIIMYNTTHVIIIFEYSDSRDRKRDQAVIYAAEIYQVDLNVGNSPMRNFVA